MKTCVPSTVPATRGNPATAANCSAERAKLCLQISEKICKNNAFLLHHYWTMGFILFYYFFCIKLYLISQYSHCHREVMAIDTYFRGLETKPLLN